MTASPRRPHDKRLPNEPASYRVARDELLQAEVSLRQRTEEVASLRRRLPLGGEIPENYVFSEYNEDAAAPVRQLSAAASTCNRDYFAEDEDGA